MDNILEVQHLAKRYKNSDFRLHDITFDVPYGSIVGLIGVNGSGKTTTLSTILGSRFKDSGNITIFGKEMCDKDIKIRDRIGVVFDANCFSKNLTGVQVSKVCGDIYTEWDEKRFFELLDRFKLPKKKKLGDFSRGMTMALCISVAFSHNASLLILDEPTGGLDPLVRDDMLGLFLEFVGDENKSILFSSHITSDLEKIADYITFIDNGKTLLNETKDKIIYEYGIIHCGKKQIDQLKAEEILGYVERDYEYQVLVQNRELFEKKYPELIIDNPSLDEALLLLVRGDVA